MAGLMVDQSSTQASSRASRMAGLKSAMGRLSPNNLPFTYAKGAFCLTSAWLRLAMTICARSRSARPGKYDSVSVDVFTARLLLDQQLAGPEQIDKAFCFGFGAQQFFNGCSNVATRLLMMPKI